MDRSTDQPSHGVRVENDDLRELINKASRGDSQALSDFLNHPEVDRRLSRIAASILERYGSRGAYDSAEELKQETYMKIISKIKGNRDFRTGTEVLGWIRSVATNIYLDRLRRNVLEKRSRGEDEEFQPERSINENQYHETVLKEALDKLDPQERRILEMRIEGYTIRQIADKLSISPPSAGRRLRQALTTILGEVDELTRRMKKSQIEIEQEQELTRHLINELRA